jgi:ParB-like chromosome segregation protein Spo0J
MEIVYKNLSELKPYENNPRDNDGAVDIVAKSIKAFGFKVPIIIDSDNVIVAGHTRYKAAEELRIESVPCIIADDLSPEQVNAFRLVDNKTSEFSEWDIEKLQKELSEISVDLSEFGLERIGDMIHEELENTSQELPTSDYNDSEFDCECPRCGFKFNRG